MSDDTQPTPAAPRQSGPALPETRALGMVPLHGMLFDIAGASAQGPRAENQDAFSVDTFTQRMFVAVADGMGGERAGRVAADTALAALVQGGEIRSLDAARYALRHADETVARLAQQSPGDRGGMGCALALLALATDRAGNPGWVGAHVGDVRIISRGADGTVRLETRDHTPAYARWEAGEIALDEVPDSPGSNRLQRAVGRGGEADAAWIPVRPNWTYLLISDGVTKAMRLDELGEAMALPSSEQICSAITRKVEERGPDDNYTAVAVRVLGDGGGATMPSPPPRGGAPIAAAVSESPHRGHANLVDERNDDVNGRRGSILPTLLSLLALAVGGFALWTALQAGRGADPAMAAQIDSLRAEVRGLSSRVATPRDSLSLIGGTDTAAPAAAAAPVPSAPAGQAPANQTVRP